jgi:hypothetical protein
VARLRVLMIRALTATLVLVAISIGGAAAHAQSVNVTTWHNDTWRTGQNTNETILTQSNVTKNHFGKLCSAALDGRAYAQPLVVTNVLFHGQTTAKTIVYVVSQNDSVYAIDPTNCTALAQTQLLEAGEEAANCTDLGNCTVAPIVGILGTPVVEITGTAPYTTGTLYAVAESECPANTQCNSTNFPTFYHRLWALDIASLAGTNGGPVQICPSGCGQDASGSAFSQSHYNRPGLLFLNSTITGGNNMVYAAFSMIDGFGGNPNGWIWAYNAHSLGNTPLSYETTPTGRRGGIWQGGAGLVASKDANGAYYLYFSTGDGTFDLNAPQPANEDAADSFVKLNTDLTIPSGTYYFAPADQFWRGCIANDIDFGSAGVLAIPETTFTPPLYYALKSDKENYLWVIDRTNPGGYTGGGSNSNCGGYQNCGAACGNANNNIVENFAISAGSGAQTRSTPAFWSGSVGSFSAIPDQGELYMAGSYAQLERYGVNTSCTPPPICQSAAASTNVDPSGNPPGLGYSMTPSVSSNSSYGNGIVWAIRNQTGKPVLYAFNATNLSELYDSGQCSGDEPGTPTKFSVPTVANGYVYIATETDFDVYGLLTRSCN